MLTVLYSPVLPLSLHGNLEKTQSMDLQTTHGTGTRAISLGQLLSTQGHSLGNQIGAHGK